MFDIMCILDLGGNLTCLECGMDWGTVWDEAVSFIPGQAERLCVILKLSTWISRESKHI